MIKRLLLALAAAMALATAAHAACDPPQSPPGSVGCQPNINPPQGTDALMLWRASIFPNSLGTVTVTQLAAYLTSGSGFVVGPGATTVGHVALWNNTTGTLLSDAGASLAVTHGGTGASTLAAHSVLLGEGTSAIGTMTLTDGQLIVGQTGADPLPKTVTGDASMAASGALTVTGIGGVTAATTATASTLAERDANANLFANIDFMNVTSTGSAGGTTILTAASSAEQILTGSSNQTFQLPDATTMGLGPSFIFNNNSSGSLVITNNGGSTQYTVPAGGEVQMDLTNKGTSNGVWDGHPKAPLTVTWGSGTAGLVMNSALSTTAQVSAGASSSTVPVFLPQRGTATTGFGGDSTHTYEIVGGTAATTCSSAGCTIPNLTATGSFTATGLVTNADLANSSMTLAGHSVALGGTQTFACADLSNGATGCSTATGTSGATLPLLNGTNVWSGQQSGSVTTLAIATATFTPDGTNNHYKITLVHASCPCTLANPSATPVAGTTGIIQVIQSATGSDTIGTWGSSYEAPGGTASIVLSAGANAVDTLAYFVQDSTHILLQPSLNFSH